MARKSRRADAVIVREAAKQAANILKTAAYVRLSREKDGDCSIQSQITMLKQFIENKPDLELADIYVDNGFTGTDFDRPEFERMMRDVYSGKVQCILVKDLSRFGRNLIDAGNYIENIFPKLGIRFIAMTDDFDSDRKEDRDGIAVPIKNMINAMYASDFSRKQVASFELHSRLGDKKIISVPYGYMLNKAENRLEPNPETAPIVQLIFKWYLMGVGVSEIAHRLNDLRVPAPSTYTNQQTEGLWIINSVRRMLQSEAYIGTRVLGKTRSASYKHIPTHATTREQWYVHENTHEAIISQTDFDAAQSIGNEGAKTIAERKAGGVRKCNDRFRLKVKCRECNRTMMYFPNYRYGDAMTGYYRCYAAGKAGDTSTGCDVRLVGKAYHGSLKTDGTRRDCGKKVHEDYVRTIVLDAIRTLFYTVLDLEKAVRELKRKNGKFAIIKKQIDDHSKELAMVQNRIEGLYTDFVEGLLTAEDYQEFREHFIAEEHLLKEKIEALESEQRIMDKKIKGFLDWANKLDGSRLEDRNLDQLLFDELIDSIYINDNKGIEIVFKCSDMIAEMEGILK